MNLYPAGLPVSRCPGASRGAGPSREGRPHPIGALRPVLRPGRVQLSGI